MSVKLVLLPFRIYPIFRPFNGTVSIYGFPPESYPSIKHRLLSFPSSQEKNTPQLISPSGTDKEEETNGLRNTEYFNNFKVLLKLY